MSVSLRASIISAAGRTLGAIFPRRAAPPLASVRRVLIVKPASLGDVLQATPAIAALRQALPDAHLTIAVGTWSRAAIENNPDVDEVLDCGSFGTPGRYGLL